MNNKTCQHQTIDMKTLEHSTCARPAGHTGVHDSIDGRVWHNDFKEPVKEPEWTCTQCDRTMNPILEFAHECTYNFTEPHPYLMKGNTTLGEMCTACFPYPDPPAMGGRCELKENHKGPHQFTAKWDHEDYEAIIENPEPEEHAHTINTPDGPVGIYCETIETSHGNILDCITNDKIVAQFRNWTSWSKDK